MGIKKMTYLELVDQLVEKGILKTLVIIEAFQRINRADFLPLDIKDEAGADTPLAIGFGQTISQPATVAFMLEMLQPRPGDKILDIGLGSGWQTALLAQTISQKGASGKIFSIERIPELLEFGRQNVAKYNFIEKGVARIKRADGALGWPEEAPFDKIIAAAAGPKIPTAWKEQLKIGGRLVVPSAGSLWVLSKKSEMEFEEKEYPGFAFVPLVTDHNQ